MSIKGGSGVSQDNWSLRKTGGVVGDGRWVLNLTTKGLSEISIIFQAPKSDLCSVKPDTLFT